MSENSTTGDPAIAEPAIAPAATAPKPRPKAGRKARDRRRDWIGVAGFVVMVALGFLLTMATHYPSRTTSAMLDSKSHAGKVISYSGEECRQQVFDNESGRVMKSEPCDQSALDGDGASPFSSPRSRLDGISKAFQDR